MAHIHQAPPTQDWALQPWPAFSSLADPARQPVLLPVHGYSEGCLGLPYDAEEVLGGALVRSALEGNPALSDWRVLPPLRWVCGPHKADAFSVDFITLQRSLLEIAAGLRAAGCRKLTLFNTSPWNEDPLHAAALELRCALGLSVYKLHLPALGLDFHPERAEPAEGRAKAQAAVVRLLADALKLPRGAADDPSAVTALAPRPLKEFGFDPPRLTGEALAEFGRQALSSATAALASLLAEIQAHTPNLAAPSERWDGRFAQEVPSPAAAPAPAAPPRTKAKAAVRKSAARSSPPSAAEPAALPAPAETAAPAVGSGAAFPILRERWITAQTRDHRIRNETPDRAVAILPVGSIEQHGLHLPVGTDALLSLIWLEQALPSLPERMPAFVAPPITYGCSSEHAGFPGTLSVSPATLLAWLQVAVEQLRRWGFRRIAILNTHGGNTAILRHGIREACAAHPGLRCGLVGPGSKPILGSNESLHGLHAGEWETALMLAACPESVGPREDSPPAYSVKPGAKPSILPEKASVTFAWRTADLSASGVLGDPRPATAERGRVFLEAGASNLANELQQFWLER